MGLKFIDPADELDFVDRAAEIMARSNPDLWNKDTASVTLYEWIRLLRDEEEECFSIATGGFMLCRYENDEDGESFDLVRKEVSLEQTVVTIWN